MQVYIHEHPTTGEIVAHVTGEDPFLKYLAIHFLQMENFAVGFTPTNPPKSATEFGFVTPTDKSVLSIAGTNMHGKHGKTQEIKAALLNLHKFWDATRSKTYRHYMNWEEEKGAGEMLGMDKPILNHIFAGHIADWKHCYYRIYFN